VHSSNSELISSLRAMARSGSDVAAVIFEGFMPGDNAGNAVSSLTSIGVSAISCRFGEFSDAVRLMEQGVAARGTRSCGTGSWHSRTGRIGRGGSMTTAQHTTDSVVLQRYESTLGKAYRKIFNDRPKLSTRVRVLVAAATVWASFTLFFLGVSPVIPLLTIPATLVGHWVAMIAIRRRMPWISMMIAGTIITAGVMMRFELVEALQGNRIPVANFLLIAEQPRYSTHARGLAFTRS
jgi:hypothetical protein